MTRARIELGARWFLTYVECNHYVTLFEVRFGKKKVHVERRTGIQELGGLF